MLHCRKNLHRKLTTERLQVTPNDILAPDLTARLCSFVYDEAELIGNGGCLVVAEAHE